MSENKEVVTIIPIVQLEDFKLLPLNTQKLINDLSSDLKVDGLTVFNPLVEAMTQIEAYRKLKYVEDNEECIGEYKLAKASVRSFRAATGRAKKELKAPFIATGKNIDAIEKAFKSAATDVLENYLDVEFKPYLDNEAKIKADKTAKKNQATTDKINELSDETVKQQLVISRMNLKSKLDKAIFSITKDMTEKVANYSKEALIGEYNAIGSTKYEISDADRQILLPEQVTELEEAYNVAIENSKVMIDMKVQAFDNPTTTQNVEAIEPQVVIDTIDVKEEVVVEVDANNGLLVAPSESSSEELEVFDVGSFLQPELTIDDPAYFKTHVADILTDAMEKLSELHTKSDVEISVQKKLIESISGIQDKVASFLN